MVGLENTEKCVFFCWAGLVTFLVNNESKWNRELCSSHIHIKTRARVIKLNPILQSNILQNGGRSMRRT